MHRSRISRIGIRTAAFALIIAPLLTNDAAARFGGGGGGFSHGGGGFSHGGGGFSHGGGFGGGGFSGIGRSSPMIHSAPMIRSLPSVHSSSGTHSLSRSITSGGIGTRHITRSGSLPTVRSGQLHTVMGQGQLNTKVAGNLTNHNMVNHTVRGVGRTSALHNSTFASLSTRNRANRALASSTFHGRFANQNWRWGHGGWFWRHRNPIIVIGWWGPLFWPWAYWDFIDYTFWPYAYDVFWPYAYDDLYVGMFGPYAYEGPAYSDPAPTARRARASRQPSTATSTVVCGERAPLLTSWPIDQIAQTVGPDAAQQMALNELKDATGKALELLQSTCPEELPSTPSGRLAAMRQRIEIMLQAVGYVQPPLQRFYDSLGDEQKARFNAVSPQPQPSRTARGSRPIDLAQACNAQAAKATDVPTDRLERALRPTEAQRAALHALNDATAKVADLLKAQCPQAETLTPPGHVAAMEQRLNAMLEAIKIVQPPLEAFYGSLSDEQKARFNQLVGPQS